MDEQLPTVDFAVESPDRRVRLLVEAKNATAPSQEWVTRFLRNLFVHAVVPQSDYFLLALRDRFYLWHRPNQLSSGLPDFEGETAQLLEPYLSGAKAALPMMSERSFELLVQAWLTDLVGGSLPSEKLPEWIKKSGLHEAVRNGTVKSQLAA